MYACMHVCIYACMHACMYESMHVCMYACMRVCMYACMHECMYACMHVCMYACMHLFNNIFLTNNMVSCVCILNLTVILIDITKQWLSNITNMNGTTLTNRGHEYKNCFKPMHGALCGCLWDERGP